MMVLLCRQQRNVQVVQPVVLFVSQLLVVFFVWNFLPSDGYVVVVTTNTVVVQQQKNKNYHHHQKKPMLLLFSNQRNVQKAFVTRTTTESTRTTATSNVALRNSNLNNNNNNNNNNPLSDLVTSRLATSMEDQIRQAAICIRRASEDNIHRQVIRLLLPIIGATDLDDWPGGSRQQMEAAYPLVSSILSKLHNDEVMMNKNNQSTKSPSNDNNDVTIQTVMIDESDGVVALYSQQKEGGSPKDDICTILLPTADTVRDTIIKSIDEQQVGPKRNLIFVNPQYRRQTDFGTPPLTAVMNFFSSSARNKESSSMIDPTIHYVEQYIPTFSLTNFICEGEAIRVVRTYPGPWRVYLQVGGNANVMNGGNNSAQGNNEIMQQQQPIDWILIGTKEFVTIKSIDFDNLPENQRDGGSLYTFGQPSYNEIIQMIQSSPDYKQKNPAERAMAAFNFIKDTL